MARQIIDRLGGTRAVAQYLRLGVQRVDNWRRRGIPARYWARLIEMASVVPANADTGYVEVSARSLEAAWEEGAPARRAANGL